MYIELLICKHFLPFSSSKKDKINRTFLEGAENGLAAEMILGARVCVKLLLNCSSYFSPVSNGYLHEL